jgi:hypothetical protein
MTGAVALLDGAAKYGRMNWRATPVRASIYVDAAKRHINAWLDGEDLDPDSGLPHLGHAIACIAILIDAEAAGTLIDDRNFNGAHYRKMVAALTPHVVRLQKLHGDKTPHHYTIADNAKPAAPAPDSHEMLTFGPLGATIDNSLMELDPYFDASRRVDGEMYAAAGITLAKSDFGVLDPLMHIPV